ncbi:MAG: ATP-binding protein [bacterium]
MPRWSPFNKPICQVIGDDLLVLKKVAEGWYVDYKVSAPTKGYSKYLSSFANQYGGYLFLGILEDPQEPLMAGTFPGIPMSELQIQLQKIRQGVTPPQVSHPYHFEPRVIEGPVASIGLPADRCIVIVEVEEGPSPPYICSNGCVYRRIGDSSEPEPEKDRSGMQALLEKANVVKESLKQFVLAPVEENQGSERPSRTCYLYLLSDLSLKPRSHELTFAEFREALDSDQFPGSSVPVGAQFPAPGGYVAQQLNRDSKPSDNIYSIRWWHNGNVCARMPVRIISDDDPYDELNDSSFARFRKLLSEVDPDLSDHTVIDLGVWLCLLIPSVMHCLRLRDMAGITGTYWMKIAFLLGKHDIPFAPMELFVNQVAGSGVPFVQDSRIIVPSGFDTPDAYFEIEDNDKSLSLHDRAVYALLMPIIGCFQVLGVDMDIFSKAQDWPAAIIPGLMNAISAGCRAAEVASRRHDEG